MNPILTFDNIYTWYGTPGCWFSSKEKLVPGTVRCIRGKLFHVQSNDIKLGWVWSTVSSWWVPVEVCKEFPHEVEMIRQFKNTFFY